MEYDSMIPITGKIARSDGSLAQRGDSYDSQNRKITIDDKLGAIDRSNLFGNKVNFTIPAETTYYIVYEVSNINIDVRERTVKAIDDGTGGVDLEVNARTGVVVNTFGAEIDSFNANLNTDFLNNSDMILYDETSTLTSTGTVVKPVSGTIIADKKDLKTDFIISGYRLARDDYLAIEFTNNSTSPVIVTYKALWIES